MLPGLGDKMPDGAILGARGAYGLMSPKSALNDWWWDLYSKANNVYPVQAPYRMAQALLGLKLAVEKAMAANGGKKPTAEQLAAALTGLGMGLARPAASAWRWATATRRSQDTAIGKTRYDAAQEDGRARRHPALPGRMREPAGRHEVGGLDQGRLPGRQVLSVTGRATLARQPPRLTHRLPAMTAMPRR